MGGAAILDDVLPPGASWSRVCRRATALTLTDLEGGANVSALLYRAGDPLERYCMPDTLKAQHVSRITSGVALYSDMGRVLASVTHDSCGWHDTITGHATAGHVAARWGARSYQEARNEWRRSAREALLVELAKHGLGARDLVANVNFFTKVVAGESGELRFVAGNSTAGAAVTLRFELDTLVVLSSVPHPLDPASAWSPRPVRLLLGARRRCDRGRTRCGARARRTSVASPRARRRCDERRRSRERAPGGRRRRRRRLDRRARAPASCCGSSTCTETRPSTRCSSTPTTTPTATAPSTRCASRATPTSSSARGCWRSTASRS